MAVRSAVTEETVEMGLEQETGAMAETEPAAFLMEATAVMADSMAMAETEATLVAWVMAAPEEEAEVSEVREMEVAATVAMEEHKRDTAAMLGMEGNLVETVVTGAMREQATVPEEMVASLSGQESVVMAEMARGPALAGTAEIRKSLVLEGTAGTPEPLVVAVAAEKVESWMAAMEAMEVMAGH